MKVKLLGEKKCPGLQTSSTARARAADPPWPLLVAEPPRVSGWKTWSPYNYWAFNLDTFGRLSGCAPAASVSELAVLMSAPKTRDQIFKPRDGFEVRPRKKSLTRSDCKTVVTFTTLVRFSSECSDILINRIENFSTKSDRESEIYASVFAPQQLGKCSESCLHGLSGSNFQI